MNISKKDEEPEAYKEGWIPFLGLHIDLSSRPLIPRPETEWWTEQLVAHLHEKFGGSPFTLLDICAGSGAIGLAILHTFPQASVSFGEIDPAHALQIEQNININRLDASRAVVYSSDLFEKFQDQKFAVITANPPYVPEGRDLPESVVRFEPHEALFAGSLGIEVIERILQEAREHLEPDGELWMECDIDNIEAAKQGAEAAGFSAAIHEDQYGRPRYLVAH